jgi:glycyl-tRNA synthetase
MEQTMETILSLCKRRGFIFPGSEIYGGLSNSWDYGPLGVELKNNIKKAWWKKFVQERGDMVGLDAALIMNPKVWEASGHLATFTDPLVECKECHERYRADQIDLTAACAKCGRKGTFTEPAAFNLMFKTFIGPKEEASNIAYLRPETAQAIFVDFPNVDCGDFVVVINGAKLQFTGRKVEQKLYLSFQRNNRQFHISELLGLHLFDRSTQ